MDKIWEIHFPVPTGVREIHVHIELGESDATKSVKVHAFDDPLVVKRVLVDEK